MRETISERCREGEAWCKKERDTGSHREKERDTFSRESQRETHRIKERHRIRERDTQSQRETESKRDRPTLLERDTQSNRKRDPESEREGDMEGLLVTLRQNLGQEEGCSPVQVS